ncbi:Pectate lyase [Quillaja saponaria]|uniref:Pectate lyase n=1 Tax=Quillaja saponaria TaxID=32244 RepID=A0AAD7KPE3_QUISA|nr:Pectate lyase [Quillaja saponaria]
MAGVNKFLFSFIFLSISLIIPTLKANYEEFDEYWQERARKAREAALKAYDPDPLGVTFNITAGVSEDIVDTNSTRRNLKGVKRDKCNAANPIDRCWRCDPNWASNRKRLADCVLGFGRITTGGKNGRFYVVTDSSDDDMVNPKPGTLRHAVVQTEPLWIIFARSMVIRLNQELIMAGDKTIDGRGVTVHIAHGAGITIQFVENVIIHGIKIHNIVKGSGGTLIRDSVDHFGYRTRSDGDGISIFGSTNVWIDHLSMSKCDDGLIDSVMGSTAITISNCHFTHHDKVMLFGASDAFAGDSIMQATIAYNHFGKGLMQRMPRSRWGFFHVINNDYTHWLKYAIGGSMHPTIISEGNRFIAPPDIFAKEVTHRDYAPESESQNWQWRSRKDMLMNGATFKQSGPKLKGRGRFTKLDMISPKHGMFASKLTRNAGFLNCKVGRPC